MLNSACSEFCTTSDHFKVAHIQEHVLPLYDLTILNSAVNVQHHDQGLYPRFFKNSP